MKTSEVLRKAGDVLRERGWGQGNWGDGTGPVCLRGATGIATDGFPMAPESYETVELVRCVIGDHHTVIWNDARGRTAAEVMIALDAAYVVALQEEGVEPGDVL